MFIDASALAAVLTDEDDARELLARLQAAKVRLTSPLAVWEATIAIARILDVTFSDASRALNDYLILMSIDVVPVPPQAAAIALSAFDRFGKGRHRAKLNFGDCFAYAGARHFEQPLMFKGKDFIHTDIEAA